MTPRCFLIGFLTAIADVVIALALYWALAIKVWT